MLVIAKLTIAALCASDPAVVSWRLRTSRDLLVLPPSLDKDQISAGAAVAIRQVRADLAGRVQQLQRPVAECAAGGDQLGQALYRRQVIRGAHATAVIDEAIIGAFDQWDQYEAQLSAAEDATSHPALPGTHRRAEGRSQ